MRKLVFALLLSTCAVAPAGAQSPRCLPLAEATAQLSVRFGETIIFTMVTSNNVDLQFWANLDTGSWTVTAIPQPGVMCLVSSGTNLRTTTSPGDL
jgi:hypothetical protein